MIKFCSPVIPDMNRVAHYLKDSFETKHLSNFGPANQLLCEKLTEFLKLDSDREIILTSSGHTALMAAYNALDVRNLGVPTYTFKSTENAATLQGIPVLHLEPDRRTGCLGERESFDLDAVVYVAALSTIPNLDKLPKRAKVIVDGAATFGTKGVYNYGDAYCLSFHATKTFPIGECGAVIASKSVVDKVRQYINFGFDGSRTPVRQGMNAKISEYTAAIGLALLEKMPAAIERRCQVRDIYQKELQEFIPISYLPAVYQTLPLFFYNDPLRARKVREVLRNNGVEILQYYRPLITAAPVAHDLYFANVCLPCHQDLTDEEVLGICKLIKSC